MYRKWTYRILARIHGKNYLIWTYSHHFMEPACLTRRQVRLLHKQGYSSITSFEGTQHSNTAVNWIIGLKRDLKKYNSFDNLGHQITKDGLFNPHFRLNEKTYPPVWFNPSEVAEIYFEMHLYDVAGDAVDEKES